MADMTPLVLEIKANTSSATASIRKLKSEMSGLGKSLNTGSYSKGLRSIGKDASSVGKQLGTALVAPMKNLTARITDTVGAIGKLGAAFKRILFYRAIRSIVREIGDAFKYGVNNLYAWSNGVGGQFAASMDRIATAFSYFKNSVGAAVAPLVNALAPAIDFVIDKAVTLLNVINQLFARLTGQSYWTRATKAAKSYGGAVSAAGGAAKEALRYLAPFDELNVLPDNSSGGGGGGSGGSGAGGLFEDMVEFDSSISNFADKLREAFEAGNWEKLGKTIGQKVNELVNDEYIGNVKWSDLGAKFGYGVNAILSTTYWTLEKINFFNIGSGVATGLNSALEQIDAEVAGQLGARTITAKIDLALGFLTNIDMKEAMSKLSEAIIGFNKEITNWLNDKDWEKIGAKLGENIAGIFTGVDFDGIIGSFVDMFGAALEAGKETMHGLLEGFMTGLGPRFVTGWNEFVEFIAPVLELGNVNPAEWYIGAGKKIQVKLNTALEEAEKGYSAAQTTKQSVVDTVSKMFNLGTTSSQGSYGSPYPDFKVSLFNETGVGRYLGQLLNPTSTSNFWGTLLGIEPITWEQPSPYETWFETPISPFPSSNATNKSSTETQKENLNSTTITLNNGLIGTLVPTSIPVTAEVNTISTKKLPKKKSKIDGITAGIKEATEGKGFVAPLIGAIGGIATAKQALGYKDTTVGATGAIGSAKESPKYSPAHVRTSGLVESASQSSKYTTPTIDAKAGFISTVKSKLTEAMTTLDSTARYSSTSDSLTPAQKTLATVAKYSSTSDVRTAAQKTLATVAKYSSTSDARTAAQKTLATIAKYSSISDNRTNAQKILATIAKYTSSQNGLSTAAKTISTIASIAKMLYANNTVKSSMTTTYVTATVTGVSWLSTAVANLKAKINALLKAKGGVYSGGAWHNIPQYAGGTSNAHGSLFLAGEAGPELVGHVGGRTEVLNQSQIAASISAGVARAINNASFRIQGTSTMPTYTEEEDTEESTYRATVRALEAMGLKGEALQNIRAYISEREVYDSVRSSNSRYSRMTGVSGLA